MRKTLSILLALTLILSSASALAAKKEDKYKAKYSIPMEGVVLQDVPDRNIKPQTGLEDNPVIDGQSPTTGLPYDTSARYMPILVQISNTVYSTKINGKKVTAAGIGQRAPWSGQYADVVYEGILYRDGVTRITFLFSDSLADGEPTSAGPVRSARMGHVYLREEWGGGIAYHGGPRKEGNNIFKAFKELAEPKGCNFYTGASDADAYAYRVSGLVGDENVTADPVAMQNLIPETTVATPHPFLFSEFSPYTDGYDVAYTINLDWGHPDHISHMYYDPDNNLYLRYSGDAPYMSFAAAEDRSEEDMEQLSFSNVIIQRITYDYNNDQRIEPLMNNVGSGNADIFIGGRYIPGYWVKESLEGRTAYYDDKGNEIQLTPGKTYIAHFPPIALLTYQGVQ